MIASRHRQRLAILTLLVRAIGVAATLCLLLVLMVSCGGQSSTTDKAEKAQKQQTTSTAEKQQTTPEAAVEEAVRGYYAALDAKDYEEAYSYVSPTTQARVSKQQWIGFMKSELDNDPVRRVTINSVKVGNVSGNKANATVDALFQTDTDKVSDVKTYNMVKEDEQWKIIGA